MAESQNQRLLSTALPVLSSVGYDSTTADSVALLIVDDDPGLLRSLNDLLVLHGHRPEQALGGRQALAALERSAFDIVLLDLVMPEVSGQQILEFAAERGLNSKIIVVSGEHSFEAVHHALRCGAFGYVRKPYDPRELIATLDNALRQHRLERDNARMQTQLRDSESLHRFIVNSSPDLVYILDPEGRITFVNDRVEPMLGYRREELIGRHFHELVDANSLEAARDQFIERRTGRRASAQFEVRLRRRPVRDDLRATRSHLVWAEITSQGIYRDANERDAAGFLGSYGTARDVSARKEAEETISFQAYHDLLTHLPNRVLLKDRLSLAIAQAARNGRMLAVLFLDLDRFKVVNDTLGHSVGDRLLQAVAGRLSSSLRAGDTLARFGGDEFTLLLPDIRRREDAGLIADKILEQLKRSFTIDGHELFVGASIGIAIYPESGATEEALVQSADIAMYHVKARGKNGYQFFSEAMNESLSSRLALERELRKALSADELEIHYQPVVAASSGRITGVEALVRWRHPVRGLLEPDAFLPIALETGLLPQLDRRVQRQALKDLARWRTAGNAELRLAVNVSAHQLELEQFVPQLLADVAEAGLYPADVKLEITENLMLRDIDMVVPKLRALRAAGVRIAIDDFGTGYSSLSYLRQFPVDALKVDRSFVADIRADAGDPSILDAIVAMARGLKLELVAEGVENRLQLCRLVAMGCTELQGYVFSCPVNAARFSEFLQEQPFIALLAAVHEQP
ncbi:MAG: hypothetical protein RL756_237 [Pseudomonadota bacterium]|jgi:diguanylate cyclase (GGDEF)-like protein/PAS domain S-box-containing protein